MTALNMIVIDGPAGTGCSTTARRVAEQLNGWVINTGALYRGITYAALGGRATQRLLTSSDHPHSIAAQRAIIENALEYGRFVHMDAGDDTVYYESDDISRFIRSREVEKNVSLVSSLPEVRAWVIASTRHLARQCGDRGEVAIVDGRSSYWEHRGDFKLAVFLDTDPRERARRRMMESGEDVDDYGAFQAIVAQIAERDMLDATREVAPLRPADRKNRKNIRWSESHSSSRAEDINRMAVDLARKCHENPKLQIYIDNTDCSLEAVTRLIVRTYSCLSRQGGTG